MSPVGVTPDDYRRLGLIANPYTLPDEDSADSVGTQLSLQAAAYKLLNALDRAADDPDHKPVFVRQADLPSRYHVSPAIDVMSALSQDPFGLRLFGLYVPLDMMKLGRVRAVLSAAAERIAGVSADETLGLWTQRALREPDESLDEWQRLAAAGGLGALREQFSVDPSAAAREVFGEPELSRPGAEDLEMLMRISYSRQDRLETDPVEGESALVEDENPADDPMLESFTTPLGEIDDRALEEASVKPETAAMLAEYVIAYTRANLSPVVARGIRAYMAQGTASMAQELKVTKAPTKTLMALLELVKPRFRSVVVFLDRIGMWEAMPHELRMKLIGSFSSLRWAIKDYGVLCFMATPGVAPELEETFSAATPVEWDYAGLDRVQGYDAVFDREVALDWVAAASLSGEAPEWARKLVDAVPDGRQLADATSALSRLIDRAALSSGEPAAFDVSAVLEEGQEATRN